MSDRKPALFDTLFRRHARELLILARRRAGPGECEDLVQESFARLLRYADPTALEDPRAFLYRVTANLAADRYRQARIDAERTEAGFDPDLLPSPIPAPEDAADGARALRRCLAALDELPEVYRHVFLLHRIDGRTHAEIAATLGIPLRTVERYCAKALGHCMERVDRERY